MPRIVGVGHVGLSVRDLGVVARFYRETLGLRQTLFREGVIAIFALGETPTDLFLVPGEPGAVAFDLASDDVDGLRRALAAAGVDCTEPRDEKRSGHRSFAFVDPEGNRVTITSAHER